jgi:hypothetical protein
MGKIGEPPMVKRLLSCSCIVDCGSGSTMFPFGFLDTARLFGSYRDGLNLASLSGQLGRRGEGKQAQEGKRTRTKGMTTRWEFNVHITQIEMNRAFQE